MVHSPRQEFYTRPRPENFSREDVLAGRVVRINPALVTITDGLIGQASPALLRRKVEEQAAEILANNRVQSFHLDVNYPDYGGAGSNAPPPNTEVFDPGFVAHLCETLLDRGAFLNLHLLSDHPLAHLNDYLSAPIGAVNFQLDAVPGREALAALIGAIRGMDAVASPVIETVGTPERPASPAEAVLAQLEPFLDEIGLLTFQSAGTAARSSQPQGVFNEQGLQPYLDRFLAAIPGALQIQGGITTKTIGKAVQMGADFVVCGTEIFRDPRERPPYRVVQDLLEAAANALVK